MELTCIDSVLTLDGSNSSVGMNVEYLWETTNGSIISGANTVAPEVNLSGNYDLIVTNNLSGCSDTSTVVINQNFATPIADAGNDQLLDCGIASLILDGTNSVAVGNPSYNWSTSDGVILNNGTTLNPEISTSGNYILTIENMDNGCVSIDSVFVDSPDCTPLVAINVPDTLTCLVTQVTIDGSLSSSWNSIQYEWTTNDGNIIGLENTPTITVDQAGNYTLTITDTLTNSSAFSTVEVIILNDYPTVVAGDPDTLNCLVDELNLDGSGSSNGSEFSYNWTTTNGNILSGEDGLTPLINQAGLYELEITNNQNGCASTAAVVIEIDTLAPIVNIVNSGLLTCTDTVLVLDGNGSSQGNQYNYLWTSSLGGNILSGNTTLAPMIDAVVNYNLNVTNTSNFCSANSSIIVGENVDLPNISIAPIAMLNCQVSETQIDASASSSGLDFSYQWTTIDGNIMSGATTLMPQIDDGGTYELSILDNQNGCSISSEVTVIQDTLAPISNAGNPVELTCIDTIQVLDGGNSSVGNQFLYQWNTTNGNIISGENTLSPQVDLLGIYQLTVTN